MTNKFLLFHFTVVHNTSTVSSLNYMIKSELGLLIWTGISFQHQYRNVTICNSYIVGYAYFFELFIKQRLCSIVLLNYCISEYCQTPRKTMKHCLFHLSRLVDCYMLCRHTFLQNHTKQSWYNQNDKLFSYRGMLQKKYCSVKFFPISCSPSQNAFMHTF